MKLTFNGSMAIIRPFGFLEAENVPLKLSEKYINQISSRDISVILLSLKNVTFFSPIWLGRIIENLSEEAQKLGVVFAICDYNEIFYELMMKTVKNILNVSMFESENIASLFLNKFLNNANDKVFIYNSTEQYKHYLANYLKNRSFDVVEARDATEFNKKKNLYSYAVSQLNHVRLRQNQIDTFIKDGVVVYAIKSFMDSDFIEDFDMSAHDIMLKIGYKFFILWVNISGALNIRGAKFLIKLASISKRSGAFISLCGINESNLSIELVTYLKDANIFIYKNLNDFYKDDTIFYLKKREFDAEPVDINKSVAQISSYVTQIASKIISQLVEEEILCVDTKVSALDIEDERDYLRICVQYYGDIYARVLFGVKKDKLDNICSIFMPEGNDSNDYLSGYSQIFSIITDKFLTHLWQKGIKVKVSLPKILSDDVFFDHNSVGIMNRLDVKDDEIGFVFVTK